MPINRVEVKDFLVFRGEFATDFCPGVNVLIGGNGTGKTTLLKIIYNGYCVFRGDFEDSDNMRRVYLEYFAQGHKDISPKMFCDKYYNSNIKEVKYNTFALYFKLCESDLSEPVPPENNKRMIGVSTVYIPEKDILEHAKGLLPFIEQKQTGFSQIYKDVLINAQDIPTQEQSEMQATVGKMISDITGGYVYWDRGDGTFYTLRTNGTRIPFANEASGFKKLGFLGLLLTCGRLERGSVLLWDEPENSLNPEHIPTLVDILLELSRNGVQVFIATHSEILAGYFSVNKKNGDNVMFYSLNNDGGQIKADANDRFDLLNPNKLTEEPVKLYEKRLNRSLGDE